MRSRALRLISVLVLLLALVWLVVEPGIEPVITALLGLTGLIGSSTGSGEAPAADRADPLTLPGDTKTLAVLPFVNLSPDPEAEFVADGFTEEIIARLSRIPHLRVISRTSVMRFKGADLDLRAVADALDVGYVVEGSARKSGEDLRITAQLVETAAGHHLWAETFRGDMRSILEIQEAVARSVAAALELRLETSNARGTSAGERPPDPAIHEAYLRARHEIWRMSPEGLENALRIAENALQTLGESHLLHSIAGTAYWQYVNMGIKPADEFPHWLERAGQHATAALALDPLSSEAHVLQGEILQNRGRPADALLHFRRGFELNPSNPEALLWCGYMQAVAGDVEAGRPFTRRGLRVDPLQAINHFVAAWLPLMEGDFEAADAHVVRGLQLAPGDGTAGAFRAVVLLHAGRTAEATEIVDQHFSAGELPPWETLCRAIVRGHQGDAGAALEALSEDVRAVARWDDLMSWLLAAAFAQAGGAAEAIEWLENAIRFGFCHPEFLGSLDPLLEPVRSAPEFVDLMALARQQSQTILDATAHQPALQRP